MSKSHQEVTIIVTVLNEVETIAALLTSLTQQTVDPTQIIICDGGSTDGTVELIQKFIAKVSKNKILCKVKTGNRSVGRNYAIELATTELIACTDAGCIPEIDWLEKLLTAYDKSRAPVVAGYYKGIFDDSFQKAVIPYALVMPDVVKAQTFLPATRSLLFEKKIWEKVSKFDETLSDNEDYAFAKKIQKLNVPISFAKDAVVKWQPRKTVQQFYRMIFRFARGDIQAGIIRPKVLFIFFRYSIAVLIFLILFNQDSSSYWGFFVSLFLFYCTWAVLKNVRYVGNAWYWLPLLQITSDIAVMHGSIAGAKIALNEKSTT